ncbi:MAG: PASTA domain-containing protein [Clostridia bacterium]|nr:PASTA domain-containing protein [Clostridia bacterium]
MKKAIIIILLFVLCFTAFACGEKEVLTIPDIVNVDEATAKTVIASNKMIPEVSYIYDNNIEKGKVIGTNPKIGSEVDENQKITLFVSLGPSYVVSSTATIGWYNISSKEDAWSLKVPYIRNGVMYIECEVAFGVDTTWKDDKGTGELFGTAKVQEGAAMAVPVKARYVHKSNKAGEKQSFTIEVPLDNFTNDRPTYMDIELQLDNKPVKLDFTIKW